MLAHTHKQDDSCRILNVCLYTASFAGCTIFMLFPLSFVSSSMRSPIVLFFLFSFSFRLAFSVTGKKSLTQAIFAKEVPTAWREKRACKIIAVQWIWPKWEAKETQIQCTEHKNVCHIIRSCVRFFVWVSSGPLSTGSFI